MKTNMKFFWTTLAVCTIIFVLYVVTAGQPGREHEIVKGVKTRIFQPIEDYVKRNSIVGFWSPKNGFQISTIDWCESNFAFSYYIAEFFNTISNFTQLTVGVFGLLLCITRNFEQRFVVLFCTQIFIAVGSVAFHGTLTHVGQQGDETPMIFGIFSLIFCVIAMRPDFEKKHPVFIKVCERIFTVICCVYALVHWHVCFVTVHQLVFAFLVIISMILIIRETQTAEADATAQQLGFGYVALTLIAAVFWTFDQTHCDQLHKICDDFGIHNPGLHFMWHLIVGFAVGCACYFLVYMRSIYLNERPKLCWRFKILPYVVRRNVGGKKKK